MTDSNIFYEWIISSLFLLGVLLIPVGLSFLFIPDRIFLFANKVNKWISTDFFFYFINKPIYKERLFYRHHKIFGAVVIIVSVSCLYVLTFYSGIEVIIENIIKLSESDFSKWINVILYFILLILITLVLIFGIIMFIRPSMLKSFENWCNHWVDAETSLNLFNSKHDLPDKYLPGNPRLFGFLVLIAAIYIIWCTYPF